MSVFCRSVIFTLLLLLTGCGLSPEARQSLGAAGYLVGQQMQQNAREQAAIGAYWQNYRFQQQQIFEMQRTNQILQQRRY
jgi:hypothetical protein